MRTYFRDRANRKRFRRTKAEADATGGTVCGFVQPNGEPVYFVVARDATPEDVEREVFRRRYGRDPDLGELAIMSVMARRRAARERAAVGAA